MPQSRRVYGVPHIRSIIKAVLRAINANGHHHVRRNPLDELGVHPWERIITGFPYPLNTMGAFLSTGQQVLPSGVVRNGFKQYLLAYTPPHSTYGYFVIAADQSGILVPVVVLRIEYDRTGVVDIWCLNGEVVDHYNPSGRLVESSVQVPALANRAYKLRRAGAKLCIMVQATPELSRAVKFLSAVTITLIRKRSEQIQALEDAGIVKCNLEWDREARGWYRQGVRPNTWGIQVVNGPRGSVTNIYCRIINRYAADQTKRLGFDVWIYHGTGWISFTAYDDIVEVQTDKLGPLVTYDISSNDNRDNQLAILKMMLAALDLFLAALASAEETVVST